MTKRIAALVFIFVCTAIAWMILGATIFSRTYGSDEKLKSGVASTWGSAQSQAPPIAEFVRVEDKNVETLENGKKTVRTEQVHTTYCLPLEASKVDVAFHLDHRQKGLLWYSTYAVNFSGVYTFRNDNTDQKLILFRLPFPAEQAIYDNIVMEVDGKSLPLRGDRQSAYVQMPVAPDQTATLHVAYRSQGMDSWTYRLGDSSVQARNFSLHMTTNFQDIDFPNNTLSPTAKREIPGGWDLTWQYTNLVSGFQIGMTMPEKLQPGPLAGQISYFAPVSLFFFFFLMFIITTLRNIDLHPMNYFFLAAAFFAFHLLMAYLVDHVSIHLAFVICSLVSIFLVVTYLRLVVGMRFAAVEAGISQFIYLVLFSYAFFFKGFTGLAVTIGAIVTLFMVMQMTGRIRWAEKFAAPGTLRPAVSPGTTLGDARDFLA